MPIYFAFFPAGYSDELMAKYFDEDTHWKVGGPYPDDQLKMARVKIVAISVGSLALTMTLSPFAAGLFGTYALTDSQFVQFVWTLGVVKAGLLFWAYYDLRHTFKISERMPLGLLVATYVGYCVLLIYFTVKTRAWIMERDSLGGLTEVVSGLLDYLIWDIGVGIFFVAIVGFLVVWWLTERRLKIDG